MSAPRSFRLAIEACRPRPSSHLPLRPAFPARRFASRHESDPSDITKGVPLPPVPESSREARKAASNGPPAMPQPPPATQETSSESASADGPALSRAPINILAAYHKPLKHLPKYGVPSCDLQLRSYSVRNLEFMADFALRAAFYLKLPASGPVPLPKRIERWTMPRSNFVHKKSQENFERITYKRLIQIQDGHRDTVEVWLAYLRKHQFYGVGMKANIWDHESLDVASNMDQQMRDVQKDLDEKLSLFGWNKKIAGSKTVKEMMQKQGARQVGVPGTYLRPKSRTADNQQ